MQALHIHAGPRAVAHLREHGLRPSDVHLVPAAAGGPKGLILNHLDRDLFGRWLPMAPANHQLHLVGASIGAWRMATAMMPDPIGQFERLARDYIAQNYPAEPGQSRPTAQAVSDGFAQSMQDFFGPSLPGMLQHPNWHLHVITSRGRGILHAPGRWGSVAGFAGLALGNTLSRGQVGRWLERTVFSSDQALPLTLTDQPTTRVPMTPENFMQAVQASCSIPFWLDPVRDIPGSPTGAHWDGGLVDYHFHWPYNQMKQGLVLYPHFQQQVIPGWLDKAFKRRHRPTPWLDNLILLAPNPAWVRTLPNAKLPDRKDFTTLSFEQRQRDWSRAVAESERLSIEWQAWLESGCPVDRVMPL